MLSEDKDSVAALVEQQFELALQEHANTDSGDRDMLRRCLSHVLDKVEAICPVVMLPTAQGVKQAYGPNLDFRGVPVLFATLKTTMLLDVLEWPEPLDLSSLSQAPCRGELWQALARSVDDSKPDNALRILLTRVPELPAAVLSKTQVIRSLGYTPLLSVLSACEKQLNDMWHSVGFVTMIALPPTISEQLRDADGAHVVH